MKANQSELEQSAQAALQAMKAAGFAHAQVRAVQNTLTELNIAHNAPSLLRSTLTQRLQLVGLHEGRRVSSEVGALEGAEVQAAVQALWADVPGSPQDAAHSLPEGQQGLILQGPQNPDVDLMADKVQELLAWREAHTPQMRVQEGTAEHRLQEAVLVNSEGSHISSRVGCQGLTAIGAAHDGQRASSFSWAGGNCHDLSARHAAQAFGIGQMMEDAQASTHPQRFADPTHFIGDVLLAPEAVTALLSWFLSQLGHGADAPLVSGTSLYLKAVGEPVAASALSLSSRFDGPGVCAVSAEGDLAPPVQVLQGGRLCSLLASRYASAKAGLPRVPSAAGWQVAAGSQSEAELVRGISRGAWVGRLSMGMPASNGDFSGVIKNSFALENGRRGAALSETMVSGNVAQMLRDITGVGDVLHDNGAWAVPVLRVSGLHFS